MRLPEHPPTTEGVDLAALDCSTVDFLALESLSGFRAVRGRLEQALSEQQALSDWLLSVDQPVTLNAWCAACGAQSRIPVIDEERYPAFRDQPNWRETLACESCGLINRLRASIEAFRRLRPEGSAGRVYLTERVTPLFAWMEAHVPRAEGSEFFGDDHVGGDHYELAEQQVRHEDVTRLSFEDEQFADVLSFDVIEHVPNYRSALAEFHRVLEPGGHLLMSAPFILDRADTLVRASFDDHGELIHHEPPEFHGDPVDPEQGVLCYYHFGWDLLDTLRDVGFERVNTTLYWNPASAYLGWLGNLIVAHKPG